MTWEQRTPEEWARVFPCFLFCWWLEYLRLEKSLRRASTCSLPSSLGDQYFSLSFSSPLNKISRSAGYSLLELKILKSSYTSIRNSRTNIPECSTTKTEQEWKEKDISGRDAMSHKTNNPAWHEGNMAGWRVCWLHTFKTLPRALAGVVMRGLGELCASSINQFPQTQDKASASKWTEQLNQW